MKEQIALLDEIEGGGFEACLISTYSIHVPFFESVVLPKLVAAGCRHVAVLVDAGQCVRSIQDPAWRPHLAGREYALLPIHMRDAIAAFHPKILLLAGPKGGRLYVGSHNLTVSGFAHNRELTNRVVIEGRADSRGIENGRAAWYGLIGWCEGLPKAVRAYLASMERSVPWLKGPRAAPSEPPEVVVSAPGGPALWDMVRARLKTRARRVLVLGPFFDGQLEFLKALRRDLDPRDMVVGIDPKTVQINPRSARAMRDVRFVDAASIGKGRGYLHAKVIGLELEGGGEALITGSANPSAPAWTAGGAGRNAEAVFLTRTSRGGGLIESLGLAKLTDCQPIENDEWLDIAKRTSHQEEGSSDGPSRVTLAFREGGEYHVDLGPLDPSPVKAAETEDAGGAVEHIRPPYEKVDGFLRLPVDPSSEPSMIRLTHRSASRSLALPYHPAVLASRGQSGIQRALRQAVASLDGEVPQLEELLKLVDRVVFDERTGSAEDQGVALLHSPSTRATERSGKPGTPSLATNLDNVSRRHSHQRRQVLSEDLIALLDALIRRLGPGPRVDQSDPEARDDDKPDEPPEQEPRNREDDPEALAALCRRKVNLLLKRLVRRLDEASENLSQEAFRVVTQTAAVLRVVGALAALERNPPGSLPKHPVLVDRDGLGGFLWDAISLLCGHESGALRTALRELAVATAEEVSIVRGSLIWMAYAAGIDRRWADRGEDRDQIREQLLAAGDLLLVMLEAVDDRMALDDARRVLVRVCHPRDAPAASAWLERHIAWGQAVRDIAVRRERSRTLDRPATPGDIVVSTSDPKSPPRLVVEVIPGRVTVAHEEREDGVLKLAASSVAVVELPQGRVAVA